MQGPKKESIENTFNYICEVLNSNEKIEFYENMILNNLTKGGKDTKTTMKLLITSTSMATTGKVDQIIDYFENVNISET